MFYYIQIPQINRVEELKKLAELLDERGYNDSVDYNCGWQDAMAYVVAPHLKFNNQEDAIAYKLSYGGEITNVPPRRFE